MIKNYSKLFENVQNKIQNCWNEHETLLTQKLNEERELNNNFEDKLGQTTSEGNQFVK